MSQNTINQSFDVLHPRAIPHGALPAPGLLHAARNGGIALRADGAVADDEITRLVQRIFLLPATNDAAMVVAFCGVDQGAGCSWVCARASEVLAGQVPGKVCIVDVNLRSPSLHEHFHIDKGEGFADAMRNSRPILEFARTTPVKNLWLITAGNVGSEPNGALNPTRLRSLFLELRNEFKYLLIDTPATSSYPDAVLLGRLTDGIVLVVGSNSTRRETARIAKENFETARVPMLGAVLNRRTYPIPEALYQRL